MTSQADAMPEIMQALERRPPQAVEKPQNMLDLLAIALQNNAAMDVIERLAALQEKAQARAAEMAFNEALNRIQEKIKRVAPDLKNNQTNSKYASYAAIDRVIRPIYAAEGMSLSFSHGDSPKPEHIRVLCYACLGPYTRTYQMDMPADGKGAKGGDVMTKTHATAAADSYAKRYLVKDIFNIAIGEEDSDGNSMAESAVDEYVETIQQATSEAELKEAFKKAFIAAGQDEAAQRAFIAAKDARKAALNVRR